MICNLACAVRSPSMWSRRQTRQTQSDSSTKLPRIRSPQTRPTPDGESRCSARIVRLTYTAASPAHRRSTVSFPRRSESRGEKSRTGPARNSTRAENSVCAPKGRTAAAKRRKTTTRATVKPTRLIPPIRKPLCEETETPEARSDHNRVVLSALQSFYLGCSAPDRPRRAKTPCRTESRRRALRSPRR